MSQSADTPTLSAYRHSSASGPEDGASSREPVCLPVLGWRLPGPIEAACHHLNDQAEAARFATLQALPYYVVNRSSNIIGASDVVLDVVMFKSSGTNLVSPENRGKPVHYLIDPPRNILHSVFGRAGLQGKTSDLFRPSYYVNSLKHFSDLETASHLDSMGGKTKLLNRFQSRSTFVNMASMMVTAIFPDDKDDKEEVEKNAQLLHDDPAGYVGKRVWQAAYFPGWMEHKRQFAGLGKTLSGTFSLFSGFRNVNKTTNKYFFNWAHSATGLITLGAGAQLWFSLDDQLGWSRYGKTMIWRTPFLFNSIGSRFQNNADGKWAYLGAQTSWRVQDVFSYLVGGADKLPDGRIVDKKKIREEALRKAEQKDRSSEPAPPAAGSSWQDRREAEDASLPVITGYPHRRVEKTGLEAERVQEAAAPALSA